MQDEALQKFSYVSKRTKRFYILFYNVFKAMSSVSYFQNSDAALEGEYEESAIPAFVLSAIGEQMRIKEKGNTEFIYRVMGFHNFVLLIKNNENSGAGFNTSIIFLPE